MNKPFLIGAALLAGTAAPAFAQGQDPNAPLQRAEVQQRLTERFGRADLNHDGIISQDEVTTIVQMMQSGGAPAEAVGRLQAMFAAQATNGRLNVADAVTHQLAAFDAADANHDGTLTPQERQAAMAARAAAPAAAQH